MNCIANLISLWILEEVHVIMLEAKGG